MEYSMEYFNAYSFLNADKFVLINIEDLLDYHAPW